MKNLYNLTALAVSLSFIGIGTLMYQANKLGWELAEARKQAEVSPTTNVMVSVRLVVNSDTFCSGVIASDTTLITAGHCVIGSMMYLMSGIKTEIRRSDNKPTGIYATAGSASQQMDTGVMTGDFSSLFHMPVQTDPYKLYDALQHTSYLISCGYPMGGKLYCKRVTYISAAEFSWLVLGQLIPGMSGGPVMLPDGTVVAVNSAVDGGYSRIAPLIGVQILGKK